MQEIDGTNLKNIHFKWSSANKPIAAVKESEIFSVLIPESSTMQVKEDWKTVDLQKLDMSLMDGAVGPISVEGAKKGDVLQVDVLDIQVGTWGWSSTERNAGLIKGRFDDNITIWKLQDGYGESKSEFLKGTRIPLSPFLGVMGVAPEKEEFGMMAPQSFGGNMDNKLLTSGSTLFLPVEVDGALFSVADPHAAQGDGESGFTGLETSATALLRLKVISGMPIRFPRATSRRGPETLLVTMGISEDLYEASKFAMEEMIDELSRRGYSGNEAYVLCSLVGDLRISELVETTHVVSMTIPSGLLLPLSKKE